MAIWETTFYYQQELRSSYMNNIINGLIKPGIYNMDAAVYTESNAVEGTKPGVYLKIKEGAVFVFSNKYNIVNNRRIRNLDDIGSYVVKCVLTEDTTIALSTLASGSTDIKAPKYLTSEDRIPVVFIHAAFNYDPENPSSASPVIELVLPSYYRYDETTNPTGFSIGLGNKLPNEDISLSAQDAYASESYSYLILGALIDKSVPFKGKSSLDAYAENNIWIGNGQSDWLANHIFTGRGFPEYKDDSLKDNSSQLPSLIFSPFYRNMYLTTGQFHFNSILYEINGPSWKDIYGQGDVGVEPLATAPTATTGYITDSVFSDANTLSYTPAGNPNFAGNENRLVVEFLFMALKSEYSRGGEGVDVYPDLSDLFTSTGELSKKILPIRLICDDPQLIKDFNTTATSSDCDIQIVFGDSKAYIPLDISKFNIKRLKKMVLNKNITLKVADYIRQYADTQSPFLVPGNGTSLLPLMISFRKINSTGTDYTDKQSSIESVRQLVGGVENTYSAVNPVNVLSYFEMMSGPRSVESASLAAEETFTTLPFLGD